MRALVWHWGRRGAGPLFAAHLAQAMGAQSGLDVCLSLAAGAEILAGPEAPECDWREPTYNNTLGFLTQFCAAPLVAGRTRRFLARNRPEIAICAMPALLDGRMRSALRRAGIPYAVVVHDATAHPGEWLNFKLLGQQRLLRGARWLFALTGHVEAELIRQGFGAAGQRIHRLWHPLISFAGTVPRPPGAVGARPRILHFGRLLPYKGLDLLAGALEILGPARPFELRVCGEGPNSRSLERLKAQPGVELEQRWFADSEISGLLAWADALVLPYREASQSGVAALALAAGKHVLSTNVGGLPEQLAGWPDTMLCAPTAQAVADGLAELSLRISRGGQAGALPDAAADWQELGKLLLAALNRP